MSKMSFETMTDPEGIAKINAAFSQWRVAQFNYINNIWVIEYIESMMQNEEFKSSPYLQILSNLKDIEHIQQVKLQLKFQDAWETKNRIWLEEAYMTRP